MRRSAWIVAGVVVQFVMSPTWVHAAPPCGNPILDRHCVYLPALTGPAGRGCERLTGNAFDDSTAWRMLQAESGRASLETDAAREGGIGLHLAPDPDWSTRMVGAQSSETIRPPYGRELWLTMWYRKGDSTRGKLRGCAIPSNRADSGGWMGCWILDARTAGAGWTYVAESLDDEAAGWRYAELRASIEADGATTWDIDDAALWSCKPGERPR